MLRTLLSRRGPARGGRPAARVRAEAARAEVLEDRRLLAAAVGARQAAELHGDHDDHGGECHHGGGAHAFPPAPAGAFGSVDARGGLGHPVPQGILGPGGGTGDYDGTGSFAPLADTFALHSNPGADHVVHLDFDGHVTTGTQWNRAFGDTIVTPAFSVDADAAFRDAELEIIQTTWLRISEALLPFDVDVTTEEPPLDRLIKDGDGDAQWGVRAVFGGSNSDWYTGGAGGVAYVGSFNDAADTPTFIFEESGNDSNGFTVAGTHEIGHTLGLSHDGTGSLPYYSGHGSGATSWGSIMGVSYSRSVIQWSRGEYEGANNQEDDLAVITSQNGFDYREDDFGDTVSTAGALIGGRRVGDLTAVSEAGVIARNDDFDVFAFTTTGGRLTLSVDVAGVGATLDVVAEIYGSDGVLIARSADNDRLDAEFDVVLDGGDYLLVVTGGGREGDGGEDQGYTDYGSLGSYRIAGFATNFVDPEGPDGPDDPDGPDGPDDPGGPDEPDAPDEPDPPRTRGKVQVRGGRMRTSEDGKSARFRVRLNKRPTDDVVIRLRVSDLTEGVLVTEKITFTARDWNRFRTVRVFGMDDTDIDGNQKFKVVTSRAVSSDEAFDRLNVKDVRAVNKDNDSANRIGKLKDRYRKQFRDARRDARREQRRENRAARRQARSARPAAAAPRVPAAAALPSRDLREPAAAAASADDLFGGGFDLVSVSV